MSEVDPSVTEDAFDLLVLQGLSGTLTHQQSAELDALAASDPTLARRMKTTGDAWLLAGLARPSAQSTGWLDGGLSRRRLIAGAGAGGAIAASLGGWWLLKPAIQLYQAPATTQFRTILPDGTSVILSRGGRFRALIDGARRSVWMESGEALWTIAHNPALPFEVSIADYRLTALGTRFNVDPDPSGLRIDLLEGALRVASGASGVITVLKSGERYWANHQPLVAAADSAAAAWVEGRLVFDDASLEQVAAKVRQQTGRRFDLIGASTATLRFSGVLHVDEPENWRLGLEAVLPVRVTATGDGFTVTAVRSRS